MLSSWDCSPLSNAWAPFPKRYYSLLAHCSYSILLQTTQCDAENHRSYLFIGPTQILKAENLEELPALFVQIEQALGSGSFVAGLFSYECGEHFERVSPVPSIAIGTPLAWFGVYRRAYVFNHRSGCFEGELPKELLPDCADDSEFAVSDVQLGITEEAYSSKVAAIHEYIRIGETYQVNLTDKFNFGFSGSPAALFAALTVAQPVPYSALIHLGDRHVLSFSPELFFRIRDRQIITRPMKGTVRRGRTMEEDTVMAAWLRNDPKNCAENVMIVDLLRNDIGRLCEFGSVRVEQLFSVEKYDTLFQMTSTVSGTLRSGLRLYDIFKGIFPSGSITGAPKIRTMQIIRQLEQQPRDVYTGSIGFFSPNGESVFNVAIRTILLEEDRGEMGVGGGITIDSLAHEEYRECLLKAEFLTRQDTPFELIESLLWDGQYPLLAAHLKRIETSAIYFGFEFDRSEAEKLLHLNARQLSSELPHKVRLTLDRQGAMKIVTAPVYSRKDTGLVTVSPVRTSSADRFLYHKTTHRQLYKEMFDRAQQGNYDDVLFFNERDELTEGAISNVFLDVGGKLLTPPVTCGLLPGIYRQHLLATNPLAKETILNLDDLLRANAVYICNAVHGMRKATVVLNEASSTSTTYPGNQGPGTTGAHEPDAERN